MKASTFFQRILLFATVCGLSTAACASTATAISGIYYTGVSNSGALLAAGTTDPHWTVTYAAHTGSATALTANEGAAYVVSGSSISGTSWTPNTTTAQWITAPGALVAPSGPTNTGGSSLPGDANYVYTLAFNIAGTGTGTITNAVSIALTLSADDSSVFHVGTNYISIVVANAGASTGMNGSGLLVYQVGTSTLIDGHAAPVPEAGTWLPLVGALGAYVLTLRRRGRTRTI
jgi:hypothetical protein